MSIIIFYAIGISSVLWYALLYLPFAEHTHNSSFLLNIIQWGIVSLLSFLTFRQEKHYRSIFFQFWIYFAAFALAAPIVLHFQHWSDGNGGIAAFALYSILLRVISSWIAINILMTYVFRDEKRLIVNGLTALVVLPLSLWLFWPHWWNPLAVLSISAAGDLSVSYRPLEISAIWLNSLSIVALLAFFLHKLRTDKPIGAYADTLMFLLGMLVAIDLAECISAVTDIQLLSLSQWAYGLIAASMIVTLLLRLKFKSQTIADYYESQCISDNPNIDRRIGYFDRLIIWCFFDPEKVGKKVFLGTGHKKMRVKRTPNRVSKAMHAR